MKFLDLFSGIGGFRLGLEQYGHECVGFCEIDKYARQSYKAIHNTEGELEYHDITKVTDKQWRELNGTVDIIAGGFPCQAFSIAGKRQGFEDETRGTLFFEIMRAAKQIQPPILFLENVKGLLNHDKGRTFRIILQAMDELGYDAEWQVLNSKDFGVPQNRERVFIIGHLRGTGGREIFPIGGTDEATGLPIDIIAHRKGYRRNTQVFSPDGITETLDTGTGGGRGHYTIEKKIIDDQGRLSKQLTPTDIAPTLRAQSHGNEPKVLESLPIKEATTKGYTITTEGDSVNLQFPDSATRMGRVGKQIANTLQTGEANQGVVEVSGLYTQVSEAFFRQPTPEMSRTLKANKHDAGLIDHEYRIRKLTPLECWRLQGFPDSAFRKAEQVNSNSQLYKQAGNSVTVNVIAAIAEKLTESNPIQR